jgi:hypothetical protein
MIAAICRSLVFCLLVPLSWCAGNVVSNPPLTVLMDFEAPHSEASLRSLRQSLSQILNPNGINVDVQLKADLPPNAQFGELVIFKMKGSCTMNPLPRGSNEQSGPLALAYTSDGQVLHFGEVECDRVRHTLQRVLGQSPSLKNQQTYGSALAIVIAHEVYHMLGNALHHTHQGLTKATLSASELTDVKLALPPVAVAAMKRCIAHEAVLTPQ